MIHYRLPPNQTSSMFVYFTALAISDTTTLRMGWFYLLQTFGITPTVEYHVQRDNCDIVMDALCQLRVWITYGFNQISAWILVAMTIHRTVSVVWPRRARQLSKRCNAVTVVVFIDLLCALTSAHLLYGHSLQPTTDSQTAECFFSFVSESYGRFFELD